MSSRALASSFYVPPFKEAVQSAPTIVRGQIGMSHARWATDRDGIQRLYTFYELQVSEVIKGDLTTNALILREMGGEKDQVSVQISGTAQFLKGEDTIIFLEKELNSDGSFDLHGMSTGKYSIETLADGTEILTGVGVGQEKISIQQLRELAHATTITTLTLNLSKQPHHPSRTISSFTQYPTASSRSLALNSFEKKDRIRSDSQFILFGSYILIGFFLIKTLIKKFLMILLFPFLISLLHVFITDFAQAQIDISPEKIHLAEHRKNKFYITEGLFTGGDGRVKEIIVKNIYRSFKNPQLERITIDLKNNEDKEIIALPRPPFYQVSLNSAEKRIIVTLWGNPEIAFHPKNTTASFRLSPIIKQIALLPQLEEGLWTFVFELKNRISLEVFELSQPLQIVLDLQPL